MALLTVVMNFGQAPIYQFQFDGNLTDNVSGTLSLTATPSAPAYTTDRFGLASKAVNLNAVSASANLASLPTGNTMRSVSFWIKYNDLASTSHDVFCYGSATANQAFGFQQISDFGGSFYSRAVVVGWTGPYNVSHEIETNPNVWYHYVVTSEPNPGVGGVLTKIYRDGVLIRQQTNISRNTNGTTFYLGKLVDGTGTINADIDDMRIYNTSLSQTQVTTLFSGVTPVVTNTNTSNLTSTSVNVNYAINAFDQNVTRKVFYYDLYGNFLSTPDAFLNNSTTTNYTSALTGLTPNRRYSYFVTAQVTDNPGVTFGSSPTLGFTTPGPGAVPIISSISVGSITSTSVAVTYTMNPNGPSNATSNIGFSSIANGGSAVGDVASGTTPTQYTETLTNLTPNTVYTYEVWAQNAVGESIPITGTFTTAPVTPAPDVTNLNVSNVGLTSLQVNFNLNAFGSATTYSIEYGTDIIGAFQTQNGGTTSVNTATPFQVQLTNLNPGQSYFVRVKAVNANGQTITSGSVSVTMLPAIVLTDVNDSNVTATTAQINYTLNTNGYNAFVEIRYQASSVFDSDAPYTTKVISNFTLVNNAPTTYSYTLTGLTPNTTYSYEFGAVAQNAGGVDIGEDAAFTTQAISAQPTAPSPQNFCDSSNPTVSSLSATGTNIKWYTNSTGGSPLATTSALSQGTYYVSQTQSGSAESSRLAVQVNITIISPPSNVPANQTFCQSATLGNIQTGAGSNFQWYAAQTGGSVLPNSTSIATGTYYLSQTISGCESPRTAVSVTVNVVNAPTSQAQTFCQSGTVANLTANGTNLKWYTSATGGSPLSNVASLSTGTYYVSQTVNACESARTSVAVSVNVVNAPTGNANQTFVSGSTVSDLVVSGTAVVWFATQADALANTNPLASTTLLVNNTTYYAMQTVSNCRSNAPLAVTTTVTLGNNEVAPKFNFVMHPNPADDVVTIAIESEIKLVEIYSLHGQKVLTSTSNSVLIDSLLSGVYFVKVQDAEGKSATQKLVIR